MVAAATPIASRIKRPDIASQWQLMWWRFKRHHMAIAGASVLAAVIIITGLYPGILTEMIGSGVRPIAEAIQQAGSLSLGR